MVAVRKKTAQSEHRRSADCLLPTAYSSAYCILAILVLAAALRCYRLDGQSLWYDEGVSAFMTTRGPIEIVRAAAADIHPPLYYVVLAAWSGPFGRGEVALRGLSVLLGTLTVWVVWRLGRELDGDTTGLAAAALLAISPLAVQYSQEVRMYALASLLAVAATWAYVRLIRELQPDIGPTRSPNLPREGGRPPVLYALYTTLATALLYTHYYGLLILAAHQIHVAGSVTVTRRWSFVPPWILANALVTVLYLPWLPYALRQTGYYPGLGSPQPPTALLADAINVLSLGLPTTRFDLRLTLVPFVVLAALGAIRASGPAPHLGWGKPPPLLSTASCLLPPAYPSLLVLWLAVPIATIVALSTSRPLYEPRFLMLVLPAWVILVAGGLVAMGRCARRVGSRQSAVGSRRLAVVSCLPPLAYGLLVVVVASLLVPTARSLAPYYFDPGYARDDYRGLARRVTEQERPDDAIVLTAPGQAEIFGYYYRGGAELYPLPAQRPIDVADTVARLESLAADHPRVWLVRWASVEADPDDVIGRWLGARAGDGDAERFGRVELILYRIVDSRRGEEMIATIAYRIPPTRPGAA